MAGFCLKQAAYCGAGHSCGGRPADGHLAAWLARSLPGRCLTRRPISGIDSRAGYSHYAARRQPVIGWRLAQFVCQLACGHFQMTMNHATLVLDDTALLRWMVNELAVTFGTADRTQTPARSCCRMASTRLAEVRATPVLVTVD